MPQIGKENLMPGISSPQKPTKVKNLIGYQTVNIIKHAEQCQVGTYMYYATTNSENLKVISKRFVPVFPFLYDDLRHGRKLINVELYLPKPPMPKDTG